PCGRRRYARENRRGRHGGRAFGGSTRSADRWFHEIVFALRTFTSRTLATHPLSIAPRHPHPRLRRNRRRGRAPRPRLGAAHRGGGGAGAAGGGSLGDL